MSDFRPVSLKEGVYLNGQVKFADGTEKEIKLTGIKDETAAIALDCVQDNGQVLVFVNTRRSAQAEAKRISKEFSKFLSQEEKENLNNTCKKIEKHSAESTKISKQL